jgi:hypothetical protein
MSNKYRENRDVSMDEIMTISNAISFRQESIFMIADSDNADSATSEGFVFHDMGDVAFRIENDSREDADTEGDPQLSPASLKTLDAKHSSPTAAAPDSGGSGSSNVSNQATYEGVRDSSNERKRNRKKWKKRTRYGNESADNTNRKELLWTTQIENVIKGWHNKCLRNANSHASHSKVQKKIFYGLGIPAAIVPLILATLVTTLVDDLVWVNTVCLIITGIINIVNGYLNPGGKAKAHQDFEALYSELSVEITSELVKPQASRQAADVFIQRIMDRYNNLNNRAPAT